MASLIANLPFLKKEQRVPPHVDPNDEVIPVHLFDDSGPARGIVLVWTFKFDDVLDPGKLHDGLTQLFKMDGWRRFSGRFRYQADGNLEIHVPSTFTEDRPAVLFSKECHTTSMADHPLASKLPRATGKVATYPGPKEFCSLGLGPKTPHNLDDFVFFDSPQFCLHVQTFTDGTLVSVTHSHVSTDLMGWSAILEAWSLILAGKPESVRPLIGYREDAFEKLWNPPPKQTHALADKVLSGWRFTYWGLRSMYESWWCPDVQSRTLCIPRCTMEKMMTQASGHLVGDKGSAIAQGEPFISEGDILTALACRVLAQHHGSGSSRELATIMAVDPRNRVRSVFNPDAAYVQNSPTNIYFFCRANKALELPLGQLALTVREAIATQATEEQLKAAAALSVESMRACKMPVIFGDKDMATQFMSNWTKGKLAEKMDFSPAIVKEAVSRVPRCKRGHSSYYQASDPAHNAVSVITSVYVVMAKDCEGNSWLNISLPKKMWTNLMAYLEQFS